MKCEKLIALALVCVMTLEMALSAFAVDSPQSTTRISGTTEDVTIDVTVPTNGVAVVNPFLLPVKTFYFENGDSYNGNLLEMPDGELLTAGKISSLPLVVINRTNAALDVGATVTATTRGSLVFGKAPINDRMKTKTAVVYLECMNAADIADSVVKGRPLTGASVLSRPYTGNYPICGVNGEHLLASFNAWKPTTYDFSANAENPGKILVGTTAATKGKLCKLARSTVSSDSVSVHDAGLMLYRLGGDVVKYPSTAWDETDGFDVSIVFSFSHAEPVKQGTIAASGLNLGTAVTLTYDVDDDSNAETAADVEWEVSDPGTTQIAAVDSTGKIIAADDGTLAAGTAKFVAMWTDVDTGFKYFQEKEFNFTMT